MKALVYKGPRSIVVEDVDRPGVPAGYALVRIKMSGICGSDVHGYMGGTGRRDPGVIMGHEISGVVEEVAGNVKNISPGQRVVVQPAVYCGTCEFCVAGKTQLCQNKKFLGAFSRNGGFAEYVSVPSHLVFEMPDDMTFAQGALVEPLAVSKCGVDKIADYRDKRVLVVGAGTIGLLAVAVLKSRGARQVIAADLSSARLKAAKEMGADAVFNPGEEDALTAVRRITGKNGVDVSIEAVGAGKPVQMALDCVGPGGSCVWIGNSQRYIKLDMQSVVTREISIFGTYIYSQKEFGETVKTLIDMNIDTTPLISAVLPIEDAPKIMKQLADGCEKLIKTIIAF